MCFLYRIGQFWILDHRPSISINDNPIFIIVNWLNSRLPTESLFEGQRVIQLGEIFWATLWKRHAKPLGSCRACCVNPKGHLHIQFQKSVQSSCTCLTLPLALMAMNSKDRLRADLWWFSIGYIYINNIVIYLSMYLCHTHIYIYMCVCVVCVWIEASYVNVFEPCQLVERQWTSLGVPRNSNNQEAKARPQGSRHLARGRMGCFFKYSFVEGMWRNMYEQL